MQNTDSLKIAEMKLEKENKRERGEEKENTREENSVCF